VHVGFGSWLKNIILVAFRPFEFLHGQGHERRLAAEPSLPVYPEQQKF
jgi:hypothetical protein